MGIFITIIIGVLCGSAQFFLRRLALKPLSDGKSPQIVKLFLFRMVIPLVFLICCALIDIDLLPFAAISLCLSSIVLSVINLLITKKRDDL